MTDQPTTARPVPSFADRLNADEFNRLSAQAATAEQDRDDARDDLRHTQDERDRLLDANKAIITENHTLRAARDRLDALHTQALDHNTTVQDDNGRLDALLRESEADANRYSQQRDACAAQLDRAHGRLDYLHRELTGAWAARDRYREQTDRLNTERLRLAQELADQANTMADLRRQLDATNTERARLASENAGLHAQLAVADADANEFGIDLTAIRTELADQRQQTARLAYTLRCALNAHLCDDCKINIGATITPDIQEIIDSSGAAPGLGSSRRAHGCICPAFLSWAGSEPQESEGDPDCSVHGQDARRAQEPSSDVLTRIAFWLRTHDLAEDVEDILEAHYAAWPATAVTSPHHPVSLHLLAVLAGRIEARDVALELAGLDAQDAQPAVNTESYGDVARAAVAVEMRGEYGPELPLLATGGARQAGALAVPHGEVGDALANLADAHRHATLAQTATGRIVHRRGMTLFGVLTATPAPTADDPEATP